MGRITHITSAGTVDKQQSNHTALSDSITSAASSVRQSNPPQQSTGVDGEDSSNCICIALYDYKAQVQEDLTFQKGTSFSCHHVR